MPALLPLSLIGWLFAFGLILVALVVLTQLRDPLANVLEQVPAAGSSLASAYRAMIDGLIGRCEQFISASESMFANYIRLPIERLVATIGEIPHTLAVLKQIELTHYAEVSGRQTGDENAINSYVWSLQGADATETQARGMADGLIGIRQTGDENATNTYVHELQAGIGEETLTRVQADQAIAARQTGDENAINSYVRDLRAADAAEAQARAGDVARLNARATGDENAVNAYVRDLQGQIATLNQVMTVRFGRDEAQEAADARNALSAVAAAQSAAEQYAHDAVSGAETQAQAEVAAAEAQAKAATQAAAAAAASDLAHASAVTAQEIATAEARAAADVLGARQYAATIAAQAAAAAESGAIAQTLPIAQTLAGTLAHYLDTCGDPMCAGLLDSAHLLSGLQALAGSGLILTLVAGLIHDPSGAGTSVNRALGGIIADVEQQVGRL